MPHTSTRVYIDTSTDPPLGIDEKDIAAVTGRSTQDKGQLCGDMIWDPSLNSGNGGWKRANAINKWAKNKSVRHYLNGILTAQQRKDVAYGLVPGNYPSIEDAMTAAISGDDGWTYYPPRGKANSTFNPTNNDEWFRNHDFNEYHHDAATPYRIGAMVRPSIFEDKIIDVVREDGAEIRIEDFPSTVFGDDALADLSNVYVYLLAKRLSDGALIPPSIFHPTGGDLSLDDITSGMNTINFTLPMSTFVNRNDTYYMVGVASTWVTGESTDDRQWVILPGSYQAAVINDQMFNVEMTYRVDKATNFHYQIDNSNDELEWGMELELANNQLGDSADSITIHFEVAKYAGGSYQILDSYTGTIAAPIDEGYSEYYTLNNPNNFDISGLGGTATTSNLYLRVYYTYEGESDTTHYVYHRYFNIWRNAGGSDTYTDTQALSDVPFTSIADILNPPQ